jgi:hypothetical protein
MAPAVIKTCWVHRVGEFAAGGVAGTVVAWFLTRWVRPRLILPTAANHRHRQAHEDQAQRPLSGIVDYREDFYYREAFSLV